MDLVGNANWAAYKSLIGIDAHDTFMQEDITYLRYLYGLDLHGEDDVNAQFETIALKGLFSYNYFRQWNINQATVSGEIDKQSEAAIFSINYLSNHASSILDANNFWDYELMKDRIIHRGVTYSIKGDTFLSQAPDEPLLFMLILKREETETGQTRAGNG